jgi:rubrerythrin
MKPKKLSKRLELNKKTIANLSPEMQKLVKGGDLYTCPACGYTCDGYYTCDETCTCPPETYTCNTRCNSNCCFDTLECPL